VAGRICPPAGRTPALTAELLRWVGEGESRDVRAVLDAIREPRGAVSRPDRSPAID
jgi:hypothetical protein